MSNQSIFLISKIWVKYFNKQISQFEEECKKRKSNFIDNEAIIKKSIWLFID